MFERSPRRPVAQQRRRVRRSLSLLVCLLGLMAVPASPALAGHEQGGSLTAEIVNGHLKGTVSYLSLGGCTVGEEGYTPDVTVTSPSNATATVTPSAVYTRCTGNSTTAKATFDAELVELFGSAPDGAYELTFSSCCRVDGIVNMGDSEAGRSTELRARVTKSGLSSSAPAFRR